MSFEVRKARRQRRPLKISLEGLSGSGKTFSALRLAFAMKRAGIGKRIVVADSENESAGLYDGVRADGEVWAYELCPIPADKQNPAGYTECYEYLVGAGFDIVIIDSLSHAWHGAMEQVDRFARANKGDKFGGWAQVTPEQRRMLTTLTDPRAHLIATMRVKSEYERVESANGRSQIKKVGMKTDQRENTEYEFDAVVRLEAGHEAHVEKVRGCTAMDGKSGNCPGPDFWKPLFDWWLSAEPVKSLADTHGEAIDRAADLGALKDAFTAGWNDHRAGRVTDAELADLTARKDRRKAALAPPAPEGEQRADPTRTAPTGATPTPPATTAAAPPASPSTTPTPKTTPTRSATDPAPQPRTGDATMQLLKLMHELDVSWVEIRERAEGRGKEVAEAAGLGDYSGQQVSSLTMAERNRLHTELEVRCVEKRQRAEKRAANKARREAAAAAEEVTAS